MKRLLLMFLSVTLFSCNSLLKDNYQVSVEKTVVIIESDWDVMIKALAQIESNGRTDAVGRTNDLGILQLTPIYVKDVNQIPGGQAYTLEDRLDAGKSVEMFNILQGHYNPERCIKKAIKLHNPRAPQSYFNKVMEEYKRLSCKRNVEKRICKEV